MSAFGVVAFLMVAGWQVGADGRDEVFAKTEVALENAKARSGGGAQTTCVDIPDTSFGGIGYDRICVKNGEAFCEWAWYDKFGPKGSGICYF